VAGFFASCREEADNIDIYLLWVYVIISLYNKFINNYQISYMRENRWEHILGILAKRDDSSC
jgi:hypothetical protein